MLRLRLRLRITHPGVGLTRPCNFDGTNRRAFNLRLPNRRHFASLTFQKSVLLLENNTSSSHLSSSTVGSSSVVPHHHHHQPLLTHRHIQILSFTACLAAISATWLFCSAIPALLAFKRAAESLEKLMDVTREELPDTMAAVRLSGMEISDLTMELNDLGHEMTQGVRKSTRAVRVAEERLRWLTNKAPIVSVQEAVPTETGTDRLGLARNVRSVREGIVKGRAFVQMFFTLTRYSRMLLSYFTSRKKASL